MDCGTIEFIMVTKTIGSGVIAGILMLVALLPFFLGTDRDGKDGDSK